MRRVGSIREGSALRLRSPQCSRPVAGVAVAGWPARWCSPPPMRAFGRAWSGSRGGHGFFSRRPRPTPPLTHEPLIVPVVRHGGCPSKSYWLDRPSWVQGRRDLFAVAAPKTPARPTGGCKTLQAAFEAWPPPRSRYVVGGSRAHTPLAQGTLEDPLRRGTCLAIQLDARNGSAADSGPQTGSWASLADRHLQHLFTIPYGPLVGHSA